MNSSKDASKGAFEIALSSVIASIVLSSPWLFILWLDLAGPPEFHIGFLGQFIMFCLIGFTTLTIAIHFVLCEIEVRK